MPASTLLILATIENSHALKLSKSMTCRVNPATISLNRPGQMGSVYKAEYFALGPVIPRPIILSLPSQSKICLLSLYNLSIYTRQRLHQSINSIPPHSLTFLFL
ncbi:hypothetical protein PGTUg99_025388 [Puccinia graminis f. sp. tritici]|uniref:Uncharacterized protein n=1 Tax=Puccinia graminis f. sp. tritici TaxID=56615 RepID=A0A5B0PFM0_PUCGR|nr:hypothetical protein PGTUg99_025388 [Puccinia graminis f. sp. tritici]